jgi:nicotinamidase-related amidase
VVKPWDGIVSQQEQDQYLKSGFNRVPVIGAKAALLVVDMQYRMMGSRPMPIDEAIAEYPTSCGEAGWAAVAPIVRMRKFFRERDWPVIYLTLGTRRAFNRITKPERSGATLGMVDRAQSPGTAKGFQIVDPLLPAPHETVICKYGPSGFFGTPLSSLLIDEGVDTVCVVGSTTSGCVRATVVDAFSYGLSVVVPAEGVFDRSALSHGVSLFDMATRYAHVVAMDDMLERFALDTSNRSGR